MEQDTTGEKLQRSLAGCLAGEEPLPVRLAAFADEVRRVIPDFASIIDRMVTLLETCGAGDGAPRPGDLMPSFVLPDAQGKLTALDTLLERGPLIVAFHRGAWCPYCRMTAEALARLDERISVTGARVVAITPNLQAFNAELQSVARARFPVLTDLDNGYALDLGLAFRVPDEARKGMMGLGIDLSPAQGNDAWMLPIPATFVVGQDGIVRGRYVDPDFRRRMAIDDIEAALRAA